MPGSESFDVFYARTVWNVTSQMHAMAGQDSAADHAIREAYARAYQQWYEIADYPDTEGWVLAAAKEAYQRRRPEAAARPEPAARPATPAPAGHDSLSWPGLYRPRTPAGTPADPASTIGGPLVGMAAPTVGTVDGPGSAGPGGAAPVAWPGAGLAGPPAGDLSSQPAAAGLGFVPGLPASITAALPGADRTGPPAGPRPPRRLSWPTSRRGVVALTAAIAVLVAGGTVYLTTRGHQARPPAQSNAGVKSQGPVMLAAGQTGSLSAIPWSLVQSGWTLAEVSTAAAGTSQPGTITTYLVDPKGGRYQIQRASPGPGASPQLLAWSGNKQNALLAVPSPASATYELLSLTTGEITGLPLPPTVTAVGFTRPDGLAILAVQQNPDAFKLQRYNLQGGLEATIGSLPRKPGSPDWLPGCGTACGALSSPDGQLDVWGITGDDMQLVGNADGKVTKLAVPGAASCVPLTWPDASTVLAYCAVTGQQSPGQLWLVPADGSAATQLTQTSGSASGTGNLTGAWQAAGATYVTVTTSQHCQGAASQLGGLSLVPVSAESLQQPIALSGSTSNHTSIVSVSGGKLLVLAQTSCPGTSSLLRVDPSTGTTTTVLAGQAGQVGVLAAVPYGQGPTATNGQ